ncbi:alpha/beta fold hydrolase [Flavobacterium cellulosilyticum]|uniref:Alpha/beta hydrolase n=1 Tax=Flavobacterium cellulosilyticum TaxID=2541731 RepID=A0A4R5C9Y9_9FLAO|nr:alpha/beta hydrolase [Flavobacterium cellulosilyticum]TDD93894.1 alpha/beta hydrolase [Flavobacterium cellulosilyticum]
MPKKSSNQSQSLKTSKIILLCFKFFSLISPKLTTHLAAKLFRMPIKHNIPKREIEMDYKSAQKLIQIPSINKEVVIYEYGNSKKKILLTHGWSGRGTQLFKIADELINAGYSTISFDAPAHGKSPGKTTILSEFVETILEIEKQFGPFEAAIGHSLGGMSLLNAVKKGLILKNLVIIGSGDIVQDILDSFVKKLGLSPNASTQLRLHFENKYGEDINNFSAYKSAMEVTIPVLVIHDKNDKEVPITAAINIQKHLINGEIFITEELGHQKILGNPIVIEKIVQFIQNKN